jgi:anti-sigma regulatory factor (Ser/Thr protein kinase)
MNQPTVTGRRSRYGAPGDGFRHEAVLYAGVDGLVTSLVPWMRDGVDRDDMVVALVTGRSEDALREALGPARRGVHFADMAEAGRNPARLIALWHTMLGEMRAPGRPVRGVGEPVWPGRGADELVECHLHESLINPAFADETAVWVKCPYDVGALDREAYRAVGASHPEVEGDPGRDIGTYSGYPDPADVLGAPLSPPAEPVVEEDISVATVRGLRSSVYDRATAVGLGAQRARDLVLAVIEASSNSIVHGGGCGTLRSWRTPHALVHEITDRGHIRDPLVGRRQPSHDQVKGRGLWLVNELCDLVQLRSSPTGTVVRLHMHLH